VPTKNTVHLTLQRLASLGKTGILHQDNRFLKPGKSGSGNSAAGVWSVDDNLSATDVIRCVYLARMARSLGHIEAARRWQAKADEWLKQHRTTIREVTCELQAPNPSPCTLMQEAGNPDDTASSAVQPG